MRQAERGRSRRRLWLVAGVATAVALAAGTWWLLIRDSTTKGSDIATVLALPVAVLSLLAAVVAIVVAVRLNPAEGAALAGAARRLAGDVRAQEEAVLTRLVADTGETRPADVGFVQPGLLHWRTDGGTKRGSLAQIKSYYQGLRRGRLVVLGQAGAGKTVLAIALVRDLAAAIVDAPPPQEEPGRRVLVPMRLSLPAFDPAPGLDDVPAEQIATQLEQWLADHLLTVYGVAQATARALVTQGWVLPVLDGLDEMDSPEVWPSRAAAVLRALNHPTPVGLRPVILTCRTERYARLTGHSDLDPIAAEGNHSAGPSGEHVVVQDATVVGVEPLTVPDAIAYLRYRFPDPARSGDCEPRWRPIVNWLDTHADDDPLVSALRSPLRLFLATTGYRTPATDPEVLTRYTTTAKLDDHLFVLLIPAVTAQHPRRFGGRYPAADVQRWLHTLAHHLGREDKTDRSGSDLRLDELWRVAGDRARYLAAAVLTTACATVLLIIGINYLVQVGPPQNLGAVLGVVFSVGMIAVTAWGSLDPSVDLQRLDLRALRTPTGRRKFVGFFAFGLAAALAGGLALWLAVGLAVGLAGGLWLGLVFGLVFGLAVGLEVRPAAIDLPHRLVAQGASHDAATCAGWLAIGLVGGLALGPAGEPAGGLAVGLALGIMFVCNSPWPRYAVSCLLLARRGELPLRPATFLDWAYDGGLVRLSGIAVQFRHREFQTWLITHGKEVKSPTLLSPAVPEP